MKPTDRDSSVDSPFEAVPEHDSTSEERLTTIINRTVVAPLRIIWADWRARLGSCLLLFYILMGTVGVVITKPPSASTGPQLIPPFQNLNYILGTNGYGEDMLRAIIHSTPAMFKMILAGAGFATLVGAVVGLVSGYKGGKTDRLLMTATDVMMTIPGIVLVIVIATIFEPRSPFLVGFILALPRWTGFARTLRSQVLTLREESYVEASRAIGLGTPSIIAGDILPSLAPLIAINFANMARGIIFGSVALYFLDILPFTSLNWGVMMNFAYYRGNALYTLDAAHWLLVPMAAIIFLSLGLILFAQGADRLFNPRIRARYTETGSADDQNPVNAGAGEH